MSRAMVWLDVATGSGVDEFGERVAPDMASGRRRPQLVDYINAAYWHANATDVTVYLVGRKPEPPRGGHVADWLLAPTPGWETRGHYMDADKPVGRFTRANDDGNRRVTIRLASELFSVENATQAFACWQLVAGAWRHEWATELLTSLPASGRVSLRMCGSTQWEPLTDESAALIRSTSPQHRIELVEPNPLDRDMTMPGFVYLDARWSYIALLRELAIGQPVMRTARDAGLYFQTNPYKRARYLVRFQAPFNWARVGVFLDKRPGDVEHGPGGMWYAPTHGLAWVDAAELMVAMQHGWSCQINEGMTWQKSAYDHKLERWRDRMLRIVATIDRTCDTYAQTMTTAILRNAARGVIRSVILQTLGSMHSIASRNVVFAPDASSVPVDARETMAPRGSGWTYTETGPTRGDALAHPEITAQVWGRAHARILSHRIPGTDAMAGALHVEPLDLLAIHGDALYLTKDPSWPDDGKIGRLRVKGALPGPLPWPASMRDVYALARKSEATR